MSDTYIPIKKLADIHNNDFYPLSAAKGTITTEDITVKNVLGGTFGNKVPASSNLYDILVQILGAVFKTGMDLDIETISNSKDRAPSSYLLSKLLLSLVGGNLNLKFKVCTYTEYQQWLSAGTIDDDTLYFTTGSSPTPPEPHEYWIITFDAIGGSVSETTRLVVKGSSYGTLPIPVYSGYDFMGWYTAVTSGNRVTSTSVPNSNATLYAHWTKSVVSGDDLLCLEEDHDQLVITEDGLYNITLNESTEPVLATEVDHDPIVTEDKLNKISLKDSNDPLLATEVDHDPVVTEDKINRINLKTSSDLLLATEVQKDLVKTEDSMKNINLKTISVATNVQTMSVTNPVTETPSFKQSSTSQIATVAKKRRGRKHKTSK